MAGVGLGVIWGGWYFSGRTPGASTQPAGPTDADSVPEFAAALPPRPVYKYSVVNGGAYTGGELAHAIDRDPVVASHYRPVDVRQVRTKVVAADQLAYMSYRRGDQIFWTRHKVRLRQGETILTDGQTQIRARCGNCISLAPMLPVAEDEPDMVEFEALMSDPSVLPPSPSFVGIGVPPTLPPGVLLPPPFGDAPIDLPWGVGPIPIAGNLADPAPLDGFLSTDVPGPDIPGSIGDPGSVPVPIPEPPIPSGGGSTNPGAPTGGDPPPVIVNLPPPVQPPIELPPDFRLEEETPLDPGGPVPVPEPGTLLLTGGGLALALRRVRRRRYAGSQRGNAAVAARRSKSVGSGPMRGFMIDTRD